MNIKEHIEDLEIRVKDILKSIDLLKLDIDKSKPIEHIGCYRTIPELKDKFLFINVHNEIEPDTWTDHEEDYQKFNHGNCYPLSMRQHLENAIECRDALYKDDNVIMGHECEYHKVYHFIDIHQRESDLTLFRGYCDNIRRRYNWDTEVLRDNFVNKWYNKLISMFLVGFI